MNCEIFCNRKHVKDSIQKSLKQIIIGEVVKILLETIRKCIAKWAECLQLCIDHEGRHFE